MKKLNQYIIHSGILMLCLFIYQTAMAQEKIKIACVGNSITEGSGLQQSYPQRLQAKVGQGYEVKNFGVSGSTLLKNGDFPYWRSNAYEALMSWAPDVVIIKFGTNDSKPQNWLYKATFSTDYLSLINALQSLESAPDIYLCTPLPVFQDVAGINENTVKNEVIPSVRQVAKEASLPVIDLYTTFINKADFTYDGVHPNDEGAELMSETIYRSIKQTAVFSDKADE